jgi:hypothetical protein
MNCRHDERGIRERGASLVEFAIAFPLFLLIVMLIIDFGRASALRAVVDEALGRTLKKAISVANLDVDQVTPVALTPTDLPYRRMQVARILSEEDGLAFIQSVGQLHTEPDAAQSTFNGAKLLDLEFSDSRVTGGPAVQTAKIMVLRPGECANVPSLGVTECNRETLGTGPTDPMPTQQMSLLMERHPIKIVAYAHLDSYVPWLFNAPIKIEAFGYRQPIPDGPFPEAVSQKYGLNEVAAAPPGPLPPQGKPVMPTEPSPPCTISWERCVSTSRDLGGTWIPSNVPDASGVCVCCEYGNPGCG